MTSSPRRDSPAPMQDRREQSPQRREESDQARGRQSTSPRRNTERPTSPPPSRVLGVFGLSKYTDEKKLNQLFGKFGDIEKATVVHDSYTRESRGFGFVTFVQLEHASQARLELNNNTVDERCIRVDFSVTKQAHSATPGEYKGTVHPRVARERDEERRRRRSPERRRDRSPPSRRADSRDSTNYRRSDDRDRGYGRDDRDDRSRRENTPPRRRDDDRRDRR